MVVDLIEFDAGLGGFDAERVARPERLGAPARRDHRLRRHAAGVQAFAAHPALLDQHHRRAERGGRLGNRRAGRARADDAKIGG